MCWARILSMEPKEVRKTVKWFNRKYPKFFKEIEEDYQFSINTKKRGKRGR